MIRNNMLHNFPVTVDGIKIAEYIWGPDIGALQGKTVRITPDEVSTDLILVPLHISSLYMILMISDDIMFMNKVPFIMSLSRSMKFTTCQKLKNRKIVNIYKSIKKFVNLYKSRWFLLNVYIWIENLCPLKNISLKLTVAV